MQIRSTFYNFLLINPEKSFSVQFRFGYSGNLKALVVNEIFKTANDWQWTGWPHMVLTGLLYY